jgi:hypothetical protein
VTAEAQQMIDHIAQLIRKPGLALDENAGRSVARGASAHA